MASNFDDAVTSDLSLSVEAFLFLGYDAAILGRKQFDVGGSFESWELGLRSWELELSC